MNNTENIIPSADDIKEIRKTKGLKTTVQDEIIGIFDTELGKLITGVVNRLAESEESHGEIILGTVHKKSVEDIGEKEGRCEYIKGQNATLDSIIAYLEKKGYKIIFSNRKYEASDRSGDSRTEIGTFMSISL